MTFDQILDELEHARAKRSGRDRPQCDQLVLDLLIAAGAQVSGRDLLDVVQEILSETNDDLKDLKRIADKMDELGKKLERSKNKDQRRAGAGMRKSAGGLKRGLGAMEDVRTAVELLQSVRDAITERPENAAGTGALRLLGTALQNVPGKGPAEEYLRGLGEFTSATANLLDDFHRKHGTKGLCAIIEGLPQEPLGAGAENSMWGVNWATRVLGDDHPAVSKYKECCK
jgi:hypothetical protein